MNKWIYSTKLSTQEKELLISFNNKQNDYTFTPVAVARQFKEELNYRFLCIAVPNEENLSTHFALITVTVSKNNENSSSQIYPIDLFLN